MDDGGGAQGGSGGEGESPGGLISTLSRLWNLGIIPYFP